VRADADRMNHDWAIQRPTLNCFLTQSLNSPRNVASGASAGQGKVVTAARAGRFAVADSALRNLQPAGNWCEKWKQDLANLSPTLLSRRTLASSGHWDACIFSMQKPCPQGCHSSEASFHPIFGSLRSLDE